MITHCYQRSEVTVNDDRLRILCEDDPTRSISLLLALRRPGRSPRASGGIYRAFRGSSGEGDGRAAGVRLRGPRPVGDGPVRPAHEGEDGRGCVKFAIVIRR